MRPRPTRALEYGPKIARRRGPCDLGARARPRAESRRRPGGRALGLARRVRQAAQPNRLGSAAKTGRAEGTSPKGDGSPARRFGREIPGCRPAGSSGVGRRAPDLCPKGGAACNRLLPGPRAGAPTRSGVRWIRSSKRWDLQAFQAGHRCDGTRGEPAGQDLRRGSSLLLFSIRLCAPRRVARQSCCPACSGPGGRACRDPCC